MEFRIYKHLTNKDCFLKINPNTFITPINTDSFKIQSNIQSTLRFPQLSQKYLFIVGLFRLGSKQGPHTAVGSYIS